MELEEERFFVLPPPMAGFFEFSMMRLGNGYDQKLLAELFYQYLNVEENFMKDLLCTGETRMGRAFVNENALGTATALEVMDYERATEVIRTASHIGTGTCYCRHKMQHLGKACDAPMQICMSFNSTASSLIKHGIARSVGISEGMDLCSGPRGGTSCSSGKTSGSRWLSSAIAAAAAAKPCWLLSASRPSAPSPPPTSCPR